MNSEKNEELAALLRRGYGGSAVPASFSRALLGQLELRLPRRRPLHPWRSLRLPLVAAGLAAALVAVLLWPVRSSIPPRSGGDSVMNDSPPPAVGAWWRGEVGSQSRSESVPPVKLSELLEAKCIATGHFVAKNGQAEFVSDRVLRWQAAEVLQMGVKVTPEGKVEWARSGRPEEGGFLGGRTVDPAKKALWFFGLPRDRGAHQQPVELTDSFAALLAGKPPELLFALLQRLEFDRRWTALEELFAKKPPEVVARLHEIALQRDSDAAYEATTALLQTRLLDTEKFWGTWYELPAARVLRDALAQRDRIRVLAELNRALAAEKEAARLIPLLHLVPYDDSGKLELAMRYMDHPSSQVRGWALSRIWDVFWELNRTATSPASKAKLEATGARVLPPLKDRAKVEMDPSCQQRLTRMLAEKDGVPWLLQIPPEQIDEPIPTYSDAAELKLLLPCLTSTGGRVPGDFIRTTAGREVANHFFDDGFAALKAATESRNYNLEMVFDGMGYVRDPRVFDYLLESARAKGLGARGYPSLVRAIGVQDDKRSKAAIKEIVAAKATGPSAFENFGSGLVDALGALSDAEALAYLKELQPRIEYSRKLPYVRARAMHGDPWAIDELLGAMEQPPRVQFLGNVFWNREDAADALCVVDTPEATAALKKYVQERWAKTVNPNMESYAGTARRFDPLAEVARRDPSWLAALALEKMSSSLWAERSFAGDVFIQLTGQRGRFHADLFESERRAPIKELADWFAAHKHETREQWLLHYFRGKGMEMERLDETALPVLVKALDADFVTHNLAVEQISAICRKFFTSWRHQESHQGQPRMTARVVGWLQARGFVGSP